jgi:hypothetical protein
VSRSTSCGHSAGAVRSLANVPPCSSGRRWRRPRGSSSRERRIP